MSLKKRITVTEVTVISKTYFVYTKHNMNFGDDNGYYGIVNLNLLVQQILQIRDTDRQESLNII